MSYGSSITIKSFFSVDKIEKLFLYKFSKYLEIEGLIPDEKVFLK